MATRVKPTKSRLHLLHRSFRLHRFIEKLLRLMPSPSRAARHPAQITTATLPLRHFGISLTGRLQLTFGLFPLALLHALKLALAMEHVKTHRDRGVGGRCGVLTLGLTPFIGQLDSS